MRIFNPEFAARNAMQTTEPRFTVVIAFDTGETDLVYFTSHQDNDLPDGAVSVLGCVGAISARTQSINPDKGSSSIGGASFQLVDLESQITLLIADRLDAGDSLRKKKVWIYKGFKDLAWENYELFFTFIVNTYASDSGLYDFKLSDIQREERDSIFIRDETNLRITIDEKIMRIPVTAGVTSGIFNLLEHDDAYTDRPDEEVGYIRIEDEIIAHTGLFTHATDGICFRVATSPSGRGALGTVAQGHAVDPADEDEKKPIVSEYIYFEGPALKILYALQTGVLYGQGGATFPENWHLGIDESWIYLDDYLDQGPDIWDPDENTGRMVRFTGLDKETGKQFIEEEICSFLGAFRPIRGDGTLGFKRLDPVLSDSSYVGILTTNEIASTTPLVHDLEGVVNKILVRWNFDDLKDKFTRKNWLIDAESLAKYQDADPQEILLRGIHTRIATDTELKEYFNVKRDRYSGAPLKMSLVALPSASFYEVGDPVRVIDDTIRDPVSGGTLDRVFEVQNVSLNLETGHATYQLFASSQRAGAIVHTDADSVLDDTAYTGAGYTNLTSVLTIAGGAITANGNLVAGKYFYNGDLTLNNGVTVTFNGHVELWIKGFFQINGVFDGAGRGLAGTAWDSNGDFQGEPGFLGSTLAQQGLLVQKRFKGQSIGTVGISDGPGYIGGSNYPFTLGTKLKITRGKNASIPFFTLKNLHTSLRGLPTNLLGTSGGYGGPSYRFTAHGRHDYTKETFDGGDGGDGGASMTIVSRGGAFGVSGEIDTSGQDGGLGDTFSADGASYTAGAGAGGYPGGVLWLMDGDNSPPDLSAHHTANVGDSDPQGFQEPIVSVKGDPKPAPELTYAILRAGETRSSVYVGFSARSVPVSTSSIQFIPALNDAEEQISPLPSDVENFIARQVNDAMNFSWSRIPDADRAGYSIKYGPVGTLWDAMQFLTEETRGTRITNAHVPPGEWDFAIKAKDYDGNESANAAYYTATMTSGYDPIDELQHDPLWTGATLTNFGIHCTGVLYPLSDGVGSDFGWEAFTEYVPLRLDEYRVELNEQVLAFDDVVRAWLNYTAAAGPSETGIPNFDVEIDYHLQAGAYDGWESWTIGELATYATKFRITMNADSEDYAMCYIDTALSVVDTLLESVVYADLAIDIAGTTITHELPFHSPPSISYAVKGSTPKLFTYDNNTETGCDVFLFTTAGAATSGVATVTFTGNQQRLEE